MKRKNITISVLIIPLLILVSCNNTPQEKTTIKPVANKPVAKTKYVYTNLIADYPIIKDSAAFIEKLIASSKIDLPSPRFKSVISYYKKLKIYGSNKPVYLIQYYFGEESMMYYPWRYQLFLDETGKYIGNERADSFALITVFKDKNPLLMTVCSDPHGVGYHCFYKYDEKKDSLINILVGDEAGITYNANDYYEMNEPFGLKLLVKDDNKDGYNDIIFYGKRLSLFDSKTGKHYTEEKPLEKYDVEFVFLYHKNKDRFILED